VAPLAVTILKVAFLGLLYFFIFQAFRSVTIGLRTPVAKATGPLAGADFPQARPTRGPARKGPPPSKIEVVDEGGAKVQTLALSGTIQVGRAEACQVRCSDTFVSAFHARLFSRDGSWYVEDLGSTNGTFLNAERISAPAEIRAGDRVVVGRTTLELRP
jgi:pSer/pThr/pTyr-binding forkhead associated (FHA) protein